MPFKGFQFNGCKNPACRNFMVPPICEGHGNSVKDGYALTGKVGHLQRKVTKVDCGMVWRPITHKSYEGTGHLSRL